MYVREGGCLVLTVRVLDLDMMLVTKQYCSDASVLYEAMCVLIC